MNRLPDWPERLAEFVRTRERMPFAWVENDCCTFAADAVLAITGRDPMVDLRGCYAGARGALGLMRRFGGLRELVVARLGEPMQTCELAQRGDVGLVPAAPGGVQAMGLCLGTRWALPSAQGLFYQPAALAAWRV